MAENRSIAWQPPELSKDYPLGAYLDDEGKFWVWVNASPDHLRHNSGWFERYEGKPKDYRPRRDAEPDEKGYLNHEAAEAAYQREQA